MPTTSSPWARPSSPAGRRLLHAEPPTLDDIPLLTPALLAVGRTLATATPAPEPVSTSVASPPSAPAPAASPGRRPAGGPRSATGVGPAHGRPARLAAVAALLVGLLAVGAPAALDRSAPAASAAPAPTLSDVLGRATGSVLGADVAAAPAPADAGQVVVALIDPTAPMTATPGARAALPLAERVGSLLAIGTEVLPAG
ncbi:MAG TPA: hypothetical protein VFU19_03690 [Iamia sp.]|nr:hypothetical protein [Iamia sp.]